MPTWADLITVPGRAFAYSSPTILMISASPGLSTFSLVSQIVFGHGGKIVLCAKFVTLLRSFAALLAGVNRMRWPYFLIMNAIGGTCWAFLFGGGAYLFGEEMRRVTRPVSLLLLSRRLA
jgi:membrane protein DedA with SNARE-associated domain